MNLPVCLKPMVLIWGLGNGVEREEGDEGKWAGQGREGQEGRKGVGRYTPAGVLEANGLNPRYRRGT